MSEFNAAGVEYLVVGAYALAASPRSTGVGFDEAWKDRLTAKFADQAVPVLSASHLIRNKRAVGRAQDLADLEWLEKSGKK